MTEHEVELQAEAFAAYRRKFPREPWEDVLLRWMRSKDFDFFDYWLIRAKVIATVGEKGRAA